MKCTVSRLTWVIALAIVSSVSAYDAEIKFVVGEAKTADVFKELKLKDDDLDVNQICFFESNESPLGDSKLILRARKKPDKSDSTVKVRADDNSVPKGTVEQSITPEEDWTDPAKPNISRSKDWKKVPEVLFHKVMDGKAEIIELFAGKDQEKLIKERKPSFDAKSLRRFGPLTAHVWEESYRLSDTFTKVTVEQWKLENDKGTKRELLELSVKLQNVSKACIQTTAAAFFKEAETKFGKGDAISKTKIVLEFYKPGKPGN